MKVFVSWAHRGEDWSITEADQWAETVKSFARLVDDVAGLDVVLDLWHLNDRDMDWRRWCLEQVRSSDYVLVAMNAPWEQRWRGTNSPTQGSGAVAEANALRGVFERDQGEFQRKVRIVMLPGAHGRDIPEDLVRLKRITVDDLSAVGIQALIDDLQERPTRPGGFADTSFPDPLVLGPDSLMLLRYRDLTRPTIKSHRAIIECAGYVWWGWWKKFLENPQLELWESLRRRLAIPRAASPSSTPGRRPERCGVPPSPRFLCRASTSSMTATPSLPILPNGPSSPPIIGLTRTTRRSPVHG